MSCNEKRLSGTSVGRSGYLRKTWNMSGSVSKGSQMKSLRGGEGDGSQGGEGGASGASAAACICSRMPHCCLEDSGMCAKTVALPGTKSV